MQPKQQNKPTENQPAKPLDGADSKPSGSVQTNTTSGGQKEKSNKQQRHMIALKICISLVTLYFLSVTPLYLVAFRVVDNRAFFAYFIFFNHIGTGPINFWLYKDFRADVQLLFGKLKK